TSTLISTLIQPIG
ncbi:hypothetical protein D038_4497B, partial [Vibrio parahaemolyticus IDH02189]